MLPWLGLLSPALAGVTINELLADPGAVVDANCDGVIDSSDDEFVEIVNLGPGSFDLTGATLSDAQSVRHTFPAGTVLGELESVVVFAGGTPPANLRWAGGPAWCVDVSGRSLVQVAASSLSLNNSGDTVTVTASGGAILAQVAYGSVADGDQSIVLDPELVGTDYVKHTTVSAHTASPGSSNALGPFEIVIDSGGGGTTPSGGCDAARDAEGVVINEFLVNAPGTDEPFEWVELYNGSGQAVDLSGWALASGTSSFGLGDPFPNGTTLGRDDYLVVGQSAQAAVTVHLVNGGWSLGNATSSSDGLRLEDCDGNVADTVVYGEPNDDGFIDDNGNVATSLAPAPGEGASSARVPDGADTDASGFDFVELALPTPGLPNDAKVDSPCGGPATRVVINEFVADPKGADTGFEWVEIFHAGTGVIDLTGWKVQSASSSWTTFATFEGGTLRPGDHLLVGGEFVPDVALVATGSLGNASSSTDGVRLLDCAGFPVDTVLYGSPNDDGFVDDRGSIPTRTAPAPGEAAALQRVSDGYDTDDSQVDFAETYSPSPGRSNPELEPVICEPGGGRVRINEFLPDPTGADAGFEWIELYNDSDERVSLAGWGISAGTSDFDSIDITFPGGTEIGAGEMLLIGGDYVPGVQVALDFSLGNGTETDGLQLRDCAGSTIDTVLYGEEGNLDMLPDDEGNVVEPYGDPKSNQSLARTSDGYDTNAGSDWTVTDLPSPGAPNPEVVPIICVPSAGGITINELLPDPDGADEGLEWIELYNSTSNPVSIAGWVISAGTSDFDGVDIIFPGGMEIGPNSWFLVGGEFVEGAQHIADFSLGNGTETDGVQLRDCQDAIVDTALYGEPGNLDGMLDDNGELVEPYGDPGSVESLARAEDGVDSDTADDWIVTGLPTPGESNVRGGSAGLAEPIGPGCGCGRKRATEGPEGTDAKEVKEPGEGGCASVPLPMGGFELLLLVGVGLRRRHTPKASSTPEASSMPEASNTP